MLLLGAGSTTGADKSDDEGDEDGNELHDILLYFVLGEREVDCVPNMPRIILG